MDKLAYLKTLTGYTVSEQRELDIKQERILKNPFFLPNDIEVKKIANNYVDAIIIGSNNKLYVSSRNYNILPELHTPTVVVLPNGITPVDIAIGEIHNMMIGSNGLLYTWGSNYSGQLGTGDREKRLVPTIIELPDYAEPVSIVAGKFHSMVLATDDNIYMWGSCMHVELREGNRGDKLIPTIVKDIKNIKVREE